MSKNWEKVSLFLFILVYLIGLVMFFVLPHLFFTGAVATIIIGGIAKIFKTK